MNNDVVSARPPVVAWLSYGGLIPFIALALAGCWLRGGPETLWHTGLLSYGAVILTFVGALHWGFAMLMSEIPQGTTRKLFVWSVIPSLLAWVAMALASPAAEMLLIIGFLAHLWQDRSLAAVAALPGWYVPLRVRLSVVASVCLAIGAVTVRL